MTKLVDTDANHTIEEDTVTPPPMYEEGGPAQRLTADTARQAPLGKPVLWVLIGALVLCGVAYFVVRMIA